MTDPSPTAPAGRSPYGKRGWLLLLWGSVWITWGITLGSFSAERSGAAVYDVVTRLLPLHAWGWVWVAVGVVGALAGAFRRHAAGFLVLMLMPFGWGVGLMASFFSAGSASGIPFGYTFVALGATIALTSGMEDAKRLLLRRGAA